MLDCMKPVTCQVTASMVLSLLPCYISENISDEIRIAGERDCTESASYKA